ncbi:DNA excision repair protein ERCC-5 [Babesia microti strain RI]|uniref:DNA excision repair protein ERCC-5 n=1 Tax=Babesia microti (strain RI) TaxID=1133968 RepID=A0A1R4AAW9_BABMR|nr:DNA excision repair protein ERCC-5 [Babesia microti strain RI]SJK86140.1 DNA excision repair protein ERCC-5 [Babesia microti strain RI]|eukprot:XP_021338334.1 DNA excision repair protein ERCC-5 [Babesia microti strain RI]
MGVSGLWDAVAAGGKIIHPKSLENKVMAIDGSFWIRHISASRENGKYDSDFIAIFFKRICKLLSYKIIPIIVFDGIAPDAKRSEINHRTQTISKISDKHRRLTLKRIARQTLIKQLFPATKNAEIETTTHNGIENNDNLSAENVKNDDSLPPPNNNNNLFDNTNSSESSECGDCDNEYNQLISWHEFNKLSPIDKFNFLKNLQKKSFNNDRTRLVNFGGTITEFSNKLLNIYMKNANVNKLLDKVKMVLNVSNSPITGISDTLQQSFDCHNSIHNVWLDTNDIIKDYNTLIPNSNGVKRRRYLNDFEALSNPQEPILLDDIKLSTDNVDDEEVIKFSCDADLFGGEFMSDTNLDNLITVESPDDNLQRSSGNESDEWEELNNIVDNKIVHGNDISESNDINNHLYEPVVDDCGLIFDKSNIKIDKIETVDTHSISIVKADDKPPDYTIPDNRFQKLCKIDIFNYESADSSVGDKFNTYHNTYKMADVEISGSIGVSNVANKSTDDNVINKRVDYKIDVLKPESKGWLKNHSEESLNLFNRYPKLLNYEEFDNICTLLKLFKIPIIFAPSEAEAQCAQLNIEQSVYGVISDDSDTLVFGAIRVVKNFFNKQRNLELYQSQNIKQTLGLTREKLALIALLCGCDYTSGVKGIGIVNALEIIEAYPTFDDLYHFRDWATNIYSNTNDSCEIRNRYKVRHEKCRNGWIFHADFPNIHAYNLLMSPKVDLNIELPKSNKCARLNVECIESIALFMRGKSRMAPNDIIDHLNELDRCLSNGLLNGQLRLYDLDGISPHLKISSYAPDQTMMADSNTACAFIRSERMRCSIAAIKNNSNDVN